MLLETRELREGILVSIEQNPGRGYFHLLSASEIGQTARKLTSLWYSQRIIQHNSIEMKVTLSLHHNALLTTSWNSLNYSCIPS